MPANNKYSENIEISVLSDLIRKKYANFGNLLKYGQEPGQKPPQPNLEALKEKGLLDYETFAAYATSSIVNHVPALMPALSIVYEDLIPESGKAPSSVYDYPFKYYAMRSVPFHPLLIYHQKQVFYSPIVVAEYDRAANVIGSSRQLYFFNKEHVFRTFTPYKKDASYIENLPLTDYETAMDNDSRLIQGDGFVLNLATVARGYQDILRLTDQVSWVGVTAIPYRQGDFDRMRQLTGGSASPSSIINLALHAVLLSPHTVTDEHGRTIKYVNKGGLTLEQFKDLFTIWDWGNNDITEKFYNEVKRFIPFYRTYFNPALLQQEGVDGEREATKFLQIVSDSRVGGSDGNAARNFLIWTGSLQVYALASRPLRFLHHLNVSENLGHVPDTFNALMDYTLIRNSFAEMYNLLYFGGGQRMDEIRKNPEFFTKISDYQGHLKEAYKLYLLGFNDDDIIISVLSAASTPQAEEIAISIYGNILNKLNNHQAAMVDKMATEMAKVSVRIFNQPPNELNPEQGMAHENLYMCYFDERHTQQLKTLKLRLIRVADDNINSAISDATYAVMQAGYAYDYWSKFIRSSIFFIGIGILGSAAASLVYLMWRKYKENKENREILKKYRSSLELASLRTKASSINGRMGKKADDVIIPKGTEPLIFQYETMLLEMPHRAPLPAYTNITMPSVGNFLPVTRLVNWINAGDSLYVYDMLVPGNRSNFQYRNWGDHSLRPNVNINYRFSRDPLTGAFHPTTNKFSTAFIPSPIDFASWFINRMNWGFIAALITSGVAATILVPKIAQKIADWFVRHGEAAITSRAKKKFEKELEFLLNQYRKNIIKYSSDNTSPRSILSNYKSAAELTTLTLGLRLGRGGYGEAGDTVGHILSGMYGAALSGLLYPLKVLFDYVPFGEILSTIGLVLASIGIAGTGIGFFMGMKLIPTVESSSEVSKLTHLIRSGYERSLVNMGILSQPSLFVDKNIINKIRNLQQKLQRPTSSYYLSRGLKTKRKLETAKDEDRVEESEKLPLEEITGLRTSKRLLRDNSALEKLLKARLAKLKQKVLDDDDDDDDDDDNGNEGGAVISI